MGREPHELSPDLAQDLLAVAKSYLHGTRSSLADLGKAKEVRILRNKVFVPVPDTDPSFPQHLARLKRDQENLIVSFEHEIRRCTKLLEGWAPKPLRSVEEERATKRQAKEDRDAAKAKKRRERLAQAVAGYQKRIDSALRTRHSGVLADVWQQAQDRLRDIDPSLSRADALATLERDHVWAAFGLGLGSGSAMVTRMRFRMDRIQGAHDPLLRSLYQDTWTRERLWDLSLAWPLSLGGETGKGASTLALVTAALALGSEGGADEVGESKKHRDP